jgi:hypothetical protein
MSYPDPNTPIVLEAQRGLQRSTATEVCVIAAMAAQMVILYDDRLATEVEPSQLDLLTGLFDRARDIVEAARIQATAS